MAKSKTNENQTAVIAIIALLIGLIIGIVVVKNPVKTESGATTTIESELQLLEPYAGNIEGFRSCYRRCREEGFPGLVCAAKCVRN